MAHTEISQFEKKREEIKDRLGIDIATKEGQRLVKKEYYSRNKEEFINDLVKIEDRDKPGVVIDFILWDEQEDVLELMEEKRRLIVLKARQLGLTWEALAFSVWKLLFNKGFSVNTVSQTEGDSKELVRRVGFILRHLPNWLVVNERAEEEDKQENITGITYKQQTLSININFPDGEPSVFKGFTSSPGAARSFTANIIILDEWAFHPDAKAIWDAAYPTINRPTGGKVIGISTGERGTFFEEMWNNAKAGRNSFTPIFLPWDVDPRRDREWYEQTKKDMPHTYRREYPSTPSDAFSAGSGAFFVEWDGNIHVPYGREWYPPHNWRIVLAYDGGYNQAAAMWFAISNDGWAIGYREYYPSHTTDPEQMEDIRKLSKDPDGVPEQIDYIIADTSCWAKNKDTGKNTVEIGEEHGIRPWRQADKDRIMGWRRFHEWLTPIKDEQGNYIKDRYGDILAKLRFTASCSNFIRLIPGMKENENKPDDLDSGQEDHLFDQARYFVMSRPKAKRSRKERERSRRKRRQKTKPRSSATGY
jgi:hypothetical protein